MVGITLKLSRKSDPFQTYIKNNIDNKINQDNLFF
jgi:hypothetical protein